jgi:ubiquinone/menaquinone biosynthesis C-methylase UbiE
MNRKLMMTTAGAGAAAGVAAWWFTDSAPYPYAQRALLDLPLPFLSNRRLDALLAARPGERILEIGPGTGLQSLHVARQLGSDGRLDIVDIQQPMLDHVLRRDTSGVIAATRADARDLPFDAATFDAAYLVTALGEIPDPATVLGQVRRVLRPGGRLIVGEFVDRHFVSVVALLRHAGAADLELDVTIGPPFAYFARLRPTGEPKS